MVQRSYPHDYSNQSVVERDERMRVSCENNELVNEPERMVHLVGLFLLGLFSPVQLKVSLWYVNLYHVICDYTVSAQVLHLA